MTLRPNDQPLPDLSAEDREFIEANLALTGVKFETTADDKALFYAEMRPAVDAYKATEDQAWSRLEAGEIDGIEYKCLIDAAQLKVDEANLAFFVRHPEYLRD